jgi:hypothetical protein
MANWTELIRGNRSTGDGEKLRASRLFRVSEAGGLQIVLNPSSVQDTTTGLSLPLYGSSHPSFPFLFLDIYNVTPEGTTYLAEAIYTNDGSGRLPRTNPDPTDANYPQFTASFQTQVEQLPIVHPAEIDVTSADGVVETVQGVSVLETAVELGITRIQVRRVIPVPQVANTMQAVLAQHRKLHRPTTIWDTNELLQFEGADINPIDQARYEVRYSWVSDPGIPYITSPSMVDREVFAPFIVQDGKEWSRPPFNWVKFIPEPGVQTAVREVHGLKYDVDENGYRQLVGL